MMIPCPYLRCVSYSSLDIRYILTNKILILSSCPLQSQCRPSRSSILLTTLFKDQQYTATQNKRNQPGQIDIIIRKLLFSILSLLLYLIVKLKDYFELKEVILLIISDMQESIVEGLFDGLQYMNQASVTNYSKADISFYKGYNQYRNTFRRDIAIHIIQTIMLAIFLPIDIVVLTPGALMVIAISLALAASIICTVVLLIEYYMLFKQYGIIGYCQLARDTLHTTEERITSGQSQQACTSTTILHAQTGSLIQGVPDKTIQVYSNMAKFQIEKINQHRFLSLNCWWRIQYFSGTSGLIAVFVLMIAGSNLNPAQIAVLCVYLVLQAFCRILFLIITLLVAVSPIICVIFCFWVCCCGPKEGRSVLDVNPTKATTDHVVKCDGQCAICLMKVDPGDAIYQLPCSDKHVFHTRCLDQWTQVKLTCPTCRANLPFKNVEVNPSQIPAEVVVE